MTDDFPYYNLIKDDGVLKARIIRLSEYSFANVIHRTKKPYEVGNMRNVLGPLDYVFVPEVARGPRADLLPSFKRHEVNIGDGVKPNNYDGVKPNNSDGVKPNNYDGVKPNNSGFYFIENKPGDYINFNFISAYFQDNVLVKTRRRDSISTWDIWQRDKKEIIEFAKARKLVAADIEFSAGDINNKDVAGVREAIYLYTIEVLRSAEVTTFRPALAVGFAREFFSDPGSINVLDICSGWGDRMAGFMAAGVAEYIGVDPNKDLIAGYGAIEAAVRSALGPKCKTAVRMIAEPFEEATLPEGWRADLIFTSPPYFDLEWYSGAESQSLVKNESSFERWFDEFLMVSLRKAWSKLRPGGFMCININNYIDFAAKSMSKTSGGKSDKRHGGYNPPVFGPDYTYRMVTEVNRCLGGQCGGAIYCGPLLFCEMRARADTSAANVHKAAQVREPSRPQPIWIWRRTMTDVLSKADGKTMLQRPAADELLAEMPPTVNKVTAVSVAQNMSGAEKDVSVLTYGPADVDKVMARADFATLRGLGIRFKMTK
jgi:hypothetical protein